jgi:hypothetical protein
VAGDHAAGFRADDDFREQDERRGLMARHEVSFTLPSRSLGNNDIELEVVRNDEFFGTLKISRGAIVWTPRHARSDGYALSWAQFDAAAQQMGRKLKRRGR